MEVASRPALPPPEWLEGSSGATQRLMGHWAHGIGVGAEARPKGPWVPPPTELLSPNWP